MEQLAEDFEILIIAWLKSGDENVTNVAYSLAKHAKSIQLLQTAVIESVCNHCGNQLCNSQKFNELCFNCGKKPA